ncbi:MAG: hypothetical protein AAGI52_17290 [Bacteroidota bacterium]
MAVPRDFSLTVNSHNGSVPPRYRKSTTWTLGADGTGEEVRRKGYGNGDVTTQSLQVHPAEVEALIQDLEALGAMETGWREPDRPRIGGGGFSVRLTMGDRSIHIPLQVVEEQRDRRDAVVERILQLL